MGNYQSIRKSKPIDDKVLIDKSIQVDNSGSLTFEDDGKTVYLADHTARYIAKIELTTGLQRIIVTKDENRFPWCIKYLNNRLYVVDTFQNDISMCNTDGKLLGKYNGKYNLSNPREISTDNRNLLYLCDNGNSRILIFTDELYLVTIVKVSFPSDVIIKSDEYIVFSTETYSISVINEGPSIKRYPLGYKKFLNKRRMCMDSEGNLLFLDTTKGLLVVDEIEFRIVKKLVDEDTDYLNYMEKSVVGNMVMVLIREEDGCVYLRSIQL